MSTTKQLPVGTMLVCAVHLKVGHWLTYTGPHADQRIVDVGETRDGRILVRADYGHGGEPATLIFDKTEELLVIAD